MIAKPKPSHKPTASEAPVNINQSDRAEVLQVIRKVFNTGGARDSETALQDVAKAMGYRRVGSSIRTVLGRDLLTAVRRGILENTDGNYTLLARSLSEYDRNFLKASFLSAIGRSWVERKEAIRLLARWLGFARTGAAMTEVGRSLINGLIRTGDLEKDGKDMIRRA